MIEHEYKVAAARFQLPSLYNFSNLLPSSVILIDSEPAKLLYAGGKLPFFKLIANINTTKGFALITKLRYVV
jgi:hypothetical protein